ncbi:MAG: hypothetical protein K0R09_2602, partial [Clostridiales bacterium]|nr:hypothetical protein [Clostridiales bacterium]
MRRRISISIMNKKWGGKMKNKKILSLVLIAVLLLVFTGCSGTKVEDIDTVEVSKYSDEMTENILTAINEGSYEKYSRDFDETM